MTDISLYEPKDEPMQVVALFSGGASGAYDLLSQSSEQFEIVGGICKKADAGGIEKLAKKFPIPIITYDIHAHHKAAGQKISCNMEERVKYDAVLEKFLDAMRPDILIGSGDMYITTWSDEYTILNVHPADLNRRDSVGNRLFPGDDAVTDAIFYGEKETRSSVHLMTGKVDAGPIVTRSDALKINQETLDLVTELGGTYEQRKRMVKYLKKNDMNYVYKNLSLDANECDPSIVLEIMFSADEHQSRMKDECDTPAFMKALELIAENGLLANEDKSVLYLGDTELGYGGITLG